MFRLLFGNIRLLLPKAHLKGSVFLILGCDNPGTKPTLLGLGKDNVNILKYLFLLNNILCSHARKC